jgi:hypothetical protein
MMPFFNGDRVLGTTDEKWSKRVKPFFPKAFDHDSGVAGVRLAGCSQERYPGLS